MPDGADTLMGTKAMEVVLDSMRMNAQVVFWGGGDMLKGWPCKGYLSEDCIQLLFPVTAGREDQRES